MLFLITTTTVLPDRPAVSGAEAVTVMPGISRAMNTVKDRTKEAAGSDKEEKKKKKETYTSDQPFKRGGGGAGRGIKERNQILTD